MIFCIFDIFFRFAPPPQNNSQEQLSDGSQSQFANFSQPEDSQEFFTQANGSEKSDVSPCYT